MTDFIILTDEASKLLLITQEQTHGCQLDGLVSQFEALKLPLRIPMNQLEVVLAN